MKVSIITVYLNAAATLGQTIDSVAAQDHQLIEHVVKDGGSIDATDKIVAERGGKRIRFLSNKDSGIYDPMNKGLRVATGDVVGFLNADEFLSDCGVVSRIARMFDKTGVAIVYGDIEIVDAADSKRITRKWISGDFYPGKFLAGWHPPHPAFYARRKSSVLPAHQVLSGHH